MSGVRDVSNGDFIVESKSPPVKMSKGLFSAFQVLNLNYPFTNPIRSVRVVLKEQRFRSTVKRGVRVSVIGISATVEGRIMLPCVGPIMAYCSA